MSMFLYDNDKQFVTGQNIEQCGLCGGVCAERTALSHLKLHQPDAVISNIIIVCDAAGGLKPGPLCREFMTEHFNIYEDDVPFWIGSNRIEGQKRVLFKVTLRELWPFPNLYGRRCRRRTELLTVGRDFAQARER